MASQPAESPQQARHRNLHSCDNCRKEKKKCIFTLPWNDNEQSSPCDRCGRKGRPCGGPVYIPRVKPTVVAVEEKQSEGGSRRARKRVEDQEEQELQTTQPLLSHHQRILQPWVPAGAPTSEDDVTDRKEVVKELGDILAAIELLRLYLYICEDNRSWCFDTIVSNIQSNLESIKALLQAEFLRLAQHAYADEEMKEHYDSDLRSLIGRFENPPQRPEKSSFGNVVSHSSSSFFAQVRNELFAKRRSDGVYSVADHLCHDICATMSSGTMSCFSLDLQRLLPTAARAITKVFGRIQIPRGDDFILPISNATLAGNTISSAQPFPLSHLTLLQADGNILRRYIQKDFDLNRLFDVDLVGGTVFQLAAHLGRTSNLELVFQDHGDKLDMSNLKRDLFGLLPHMIAGCRNNVDALKFFVKHGAKLNAVDKNNQTCLDLSVQMGSTNVVDWLLKNGYGHCSYKNPIYHAVEYMQFGVIDVFLLHYSVVPHHNYQDISDAADLAEGWLVPGSIDEPRWRTIATALRKLESNPASYHSSTMRSLFDVDHQDALNMSLLSSTPSQNTPYAYANSQFTQDTPNPEHFDPSMPQMYGFADPFQQNGYG